MLTPIIHNINIDLSRKINTNQPIIIKQNDTNSHLFKLNIMNDGLVYDLTGTTARIYFRKYDKTTVFADCVIDDAITGKISYLLGTQTVSFAGLVTSEVTIYGSTGEILTTVSFNFLVSAVVRNDAAIESLSEFTALTNALLAVNGINGKVDATDFNTFKDSTTSSLADKANKKDIIYLSDYIVNYDKTALTYNNCDSAFVNAIADCKTGGMLVLPTGMIFVSSTFTINNPITITGGYGSCIECIGQCDLFYVNCNDVHFINIKIEHTYYWDASKYAIMRSGDYTGIRFQTGRRHLVDKCTILGFSTNIHFVNCDFFSVTNSYILKSFNYGIIVENQGTPDSGDSLIHGNVFVGGVSPEYQAYAVIKQRSGGGLKISDNKILSGQIGIHISIATNTRTGVLIITGNSVEGQIVNCLRMEYETGATNSSFVRTIINDNEFLANLCTSDAIIFDASLVSGSMKDLTLQGNTIGDVQSTSNAININGMTGVNISGNTIIGGVKGIVIQAYTQDIKIYDNTINNYSAITHVGYANRGYNKKTNIRHTSFYDFSNNSLINAINTCIANFGNSKALASFKYTITAMGTINTVANESFYVQKEYLIANSVNGSYFNTPVLISSTVQGIAISLEYDSSGYIKIKRADTYADTTYTISGTIKATVDGIPYYVGGNNIS